MKYYLVAGEASGDLHGSNLLQSISAYDKEADFRYFGGDLMQNIGGKLVKHYKQHAFMGFFPVIKNLKTIIKTIEFCKTDILSYKPDIVILIDFPGFNLRIARFAKKNDFKVIYYISPTVWAWHKSRITTLKNFVDKLFVILPFEKDFFAKQDYQVEYEGHPLIDQIEKLKPHLLEKNDFCNKYKLESKPIVAVLPGSRRQEISRMLGIMTLFIRKFNDFQFVVASVSTIEHSFYQKFLKTDNVKFVCNDTYSLLKNADYAIVKSGTSTLETALFNVPQIVCYKTGNITFNIAKLLVNVKFISLVNLILDKEVVKELIQNEMNETRLTEEFRVLTTNNELKNNILQQYSLLRNKLGSVGVSQRIAAKIIDFIKKK